MATPFLLRDWNAKVGSQETPAVTGKFGLGMRNEAGQRLIVFCQENALVVANTLFQQHKRGLYDEKDIFFWVLVLKVLVGLHSTVHLQLLSFTGWGIDLDYGDVEWFALETNRDHSVVFEIASKYCILDSFVDPDGYSISSKGFLPTVVDIMVI